MITPLPSTTASTATVFQQQQEQLEEAAEQKQEQIARLKKVQESLIFQTGGVNQATQSVQEVLINDSFKKSPLNHHLKPFRPEDPLEQFEQLLTIAKKVKESEFTTVVNGYIQELNETVGTTMAYAENTEDKVKELDITIENYRRLVEERKKTVNLTKRLTQELTK